MSAFKFKGKDGQDVIMDYSELLKLKGKDADSYLVRKLKSGEASPLNQIQGLDEQLGETNEQGDVLFRNPLEYAEIKKEEPQVDATVEEEPMASSSEDISSDLQKVDVPEVDIEEKKNKRNFIRRTIDFIKQSKNPNIKKNEKGSWVDENNAVLPKEDQENNNKNSAFENIQNKVTVDTDEFFAPIIGDDVESNTSTAKNIFETPVDDTIDYLKAAYPEYEFEKVEARDSFNQIEQSKFVNVLPYDDIDGGGSGLFSANSFNNYRPTGAIKVTAPNGNTVNIPTGHKLGGESSTRGFIEGDVGLNKNNLLSQQMLVDFFVANPSEEWSTYKAESDEERGEDGSNFIEILSEQTDISEEEKKKIDEEVDAISFKWDLAKPSITNNSKTLGMLKTIQGSQPKFTPKDQTNELTILAQLDLLAKTNQFTEEEIEEARGSMQNGILPKMNEARLQAEALTRIQIKNDKKISARKAIIENVIEGLKEGQDFSKGVSLPTDDPRSSILIATDDTTGELIYEAEALKDKNVEKWYSIQAEIEAISKTIDDSWVGQILDKYRDAVGNPDYEFENSTEKYIYDVAVLAYVAEYEKIEKLKQEQNKIADKVGNLAVSIELLKKNYDNLDKFIALLPKQFGLQARNISYGLTQFLSLGFYDKQFASIKKYNEEYQNILATYKRNVTAGEAFDSAENMFIFAGQTLREQAANFVTLAIPYVGPYLVGVGSFGSRMYEVDNEVSMGYIDKGGFNKYMQSIAFGLTDYLTIRVATLPIINKAIKGFDDIKRSIQATGITSTLSRSYIAGSMVKGPVLEVSTELAANTIQNIVSGKNIFENWDHVTLSSALFGIGFTWTPALSGIILGKLAPGTRNARVQDLMKEISGYQLEIERVGENTEQGKRLKKQIKETQAIIDTELTKLTTKIASMKPWVKTILLGLSSKIEDAKRSINDIENDSSLTREDKLRKQKVLIDKIRKLDNQRETLFADKDAFSAFTIALADGELDAERAFQLARNKNPKASKLELTQEATQIYNEIKVRENAATTGKFTDEQILDDNEAAIALLDKQLEQGSISQQKYDVLKKGIENGNFGFNVDGTSYIIVENSAKEEILGIGIHEPTHNVTKADMKTEKGRAKYRSFGELIMAALEATNPTLFFEAKLRLLPYTSLKDANINASEFMSAIPDANIDEVIAVIMEQYPKLRPLIVEGRLAREIMDALVLGKDAPLKDLSLNDADKVVEFLDETYERVTDGTFIIGDIAEDSDTRQDIKDEAEGDVKWSIGGFDYDYDEDFDDTSGDFVYETKDEVNPDDDRTLFDETIVGETNESWKKGGFERSFNKIFPLIGKYIKSKLGKFTNIPNFDYEEAYLQAFSEITAHLQNFKPEDNDSLYGWFTSTLRFEVMDGVLKTVKADPELTAVNVDDVPLGDAEITEDSTEAMLDAAVNNGMTFGDLIFTMHGIDKAEFDDDIKRAIKPIIITAAKKHGVGTIEFFNEIKESGTIRFFDLLKNILGSPNSPVYQTFLSNYGEQIYDMIPQEVMNKRMQDFIVKVVERANKEQMEKLDAITTDDVKPAKGAGNAIFTKKDYNEQEFVDFFLKPKKGRPASKQTTLLEIISFEMTKDLTMQLLSDPDFVQDNKDYLSDINLGKVALQLQRDQDVKWSRTWRTMKVDERSIIISAMPQLQVGLFNSTTEDDYIRVITEGLEGRISKTKLKNFAKDLFKKINPDIIVRKDKSPADIGNITIEYLTESEQVNEYAKEMLKGTDYKSFTEAFDDSNFINDAIRSTITAIRAELNFNNGDKAKTLHTILKWYTGHLAGNTKIGRGDHVRDGKTVFVVKDNNLTYDKNGDKKTMRDQILRDKQHLVDVCKVALGLSDADLDAMLVRDGTGIKGVIVDGKELSTKILAQDVEAGQKRTYEESQKEADEGWDVLMRLLNSYKEQGSNAQFGALMVSLKSNMSTLLKAIAPVQYKSLDKVVKKATHRWEHMRPAFDVVVSLTDFVLNEDSDVDLDQLKEEFKVAIISKDFDALVNIFYQYTLPKSRKALERYYNIRFKGNKDVQPLLDEKTGKIIGQEFTQGDVETVMTEESREVYSKITDGDFVYNPDSGASLFDMDDTLRFGDEKTWYTIPNPKNDPKPNFKAIHVIGIDNMSNDKVIKALGLENKGFVVVKTKQELDAAIKEGKGVVIDNTDKSISDANNQFEEIASNGYQQTAIILTGDVKGKLGQKVQDYKDMFDGKVFEFDGDNITNKFKTAVEKFTNGFEAGKLDAEQFASEGKALLDKGAVFDFSEFGTVQGGDQGPAFAKLKEKYDKYGPDNIYVVTARPKVAAEPIQKWLESQGITLPLENIRCLENSTAEAKALETLKIVNEKNLTDVLFDDDAPQNVQAVKEILEDIGIDFNMYQAGVKWSETLGDQFREMLARNAGLDITREISDAEARMRGRTAQGIFDKFYIPPSAEDFMGLMYRFMGKGEDGNKDHEFLLNNLSRVYGEAIQKQDFERQKISEDYSSLKKENKEAVKMLKKKVPGFKTNYTYEHAVRVWIWQRMGLKAEDLGLSPREFTRLTSAVGKDPKLIKFASELMVVSQQADGYIKPNDYWTAETIASDLERIVRDKGKDHLDEFKANRAAIFGDWQGGKLVGQNINAIRATYGDNLVEALEDILWRMENGSNRNHGGNRLVNRFMNWTNNSVGAIMFFNMRSAVLQTMSAVNYVNWSDNNMLKAAAAFANQKQFWQDFALLFNSDWLKQRRAGLKINVNAAELQQQLAAYGAQNKAKGAFQYLIKLGFTPTQIADSFAIASGGATFYRNRIKSYVKDGMELVDAEAQALKDTREIAEKTQQSARADLISQQQASGLGRIILAFANTPMQYARETKKAVLDLVNGRGDVATNVSKIIYYGAVQNIVFGALQSAYFAVLMGESDDEETDLTDKQIEKRDEENKAKITRILNSALDSQLRGMGVTGSVASTIKNTIIKYVEEEGKGWNMQRDMVLIEALKISPPISSKIRKLNTAMKSWSYNEATIDEMELSDPNNPIWEVIGNVVSATTNIPLDRVVSKIQNTNAAISQDLQAWQRLALVMGWNTWDLDVDLESKVEARKIADQKKKERKQAEKDAKKAEEKRLKEEAAEAERKRKEAEGIKQVRCSQIKKNGERCKMIVETKNKTAKCVYHK